MKPWLTALILLLISPMLAAITIAEISFDADFSVSGAELRKASGLVLGQEYEPSKVSQAIAGIQAYLQSQGDYYVLVFNPELIALDSQHIHLQFRLRRMADSGAVRIKYSGLRHFSLSTLHNLAYTSEEGEYALVDLPRIMQRVLELYQERGYLFARVQLDSIVYEQGLVAYIQIQEGKIFEPQRYHFRGNKVTREATILKNSGLLGEKIITPTKLLQAEQNLNSKSYITSSRILPVDDTSLLFDIQEGRMTYLEGVLGLSDESGKRKLSGMVNIDFQNLWGTDRAINLYWRSTPNQYSELKFRYHEAGLPSLPLGADLELARSSQDTLWIISSMGAQVYYQSLYQKYGISGYGQSVLPGSGNSEFEKSSSQSIGAFWGYQNILGERIPQRGVKLNASYQYIFGEDSNNGSFQADARIYHPIRNRWIAHFGTSVKSYEKSEVAEYDRFRMGGHNSLRGFREDEFQSWRLAWLNAELRYMLGPQSMIYAFYDHGFMALDDSRLKMDLFSVGAGISIGTRIGILSLGYGLPYRDNSFTDIGLGMIHMGVDVAL